MDNNMKSVSQKSSSVIIEKPRLLRFAHAGIVLTVIALLPVLFIYAVQFIDRIIPDGLSQSQGYWLLLPMLIVNMLMVTVVPISTILALIFSILATLKSKARAHTIGIVVLIVIVFGIVVTLPLLQDFESILF